MPDPVYVHCLCNMQHCAAHWGTLGTLSMLQYVCTLQRLAVIIIIIPLQQLNEVARSGIVFLFGM